MPTFDWPSNLTDINQTLTYANTASEGYLGLSLLLIIFCVMFFSLKLRYPSGACISASMFMTTISSVLIYLFGIIPPEVPPILTIMTAFATAILLVKGGGA